MNELEQHPEFGSAVKDTVDFSEQSKDRRARVKMVRDMFYTSKKHKHDRTKQWLQNLKLYLGNHWDPYGHRHEHRSQIVMNMIFALVETTIPIYLEAKPNAFVVPKHPENATQARMLQKTKDHIWHVTDMDMKLGETGFNVVVYGTGFLHQYWDESKNDLGVSAISPFRIFPDPSAVEVDDCQFVIHAYPLSLWHIQQLWPDEGRRVKAERIPAEIDNPEITQKSDRVDVQSPTSSGIEADDAYGDGGSYPPEWEGEGPTEIENRKTVLEYDSKEDYRYKYGRAVVLDCFWRSTETHRVSKDVAVLDELGQLQIRRETYEELKYPNGRRTIVSGNIELEDTPSPWTDGSFPFTKVLNYVLPGCMWGTSDLEMGETLQMELDKSLALMVDHRNFSGRPGYWAEEGSVDVDEIDYRPGVVNFYTGQKAPEKMVPTSLPSWISRLPQDTIRYMEMIFGIHDVDQGRKPAGIESGKAILALQERSETRIRRKVVNLEHALKIFIRKLLRAAQILYDPYEHTINIVGESFRPYVSTINMAELDIEFDVLVETGSTIQSNPEAQHNTILKLVEVDAFNPENPQALTILELVEPTIRLPGLRRAIDRMNEAKDEEPAPEPAGAPAAPV